MPQLKFHAGALIIVFGYLIGMLGIGFFAYRRRVEESLQDYFLGGKTVGSLVLFFTLLATQYSGSTFFGFTGMAYRVGLIWVISVGLLVLIVVAYLSFAPRLYVLSKKYQYVTPSDYFAHRFESPMIRLATATFLIATMLPYLVLQIIAMAHAFTGITAGQAPFWLGVLLTSAIMLIYVLLGGFRGVAWTDTLQGALLTFLLLLATVLLVGEYGGLRTIFEKARVAFPEKVSAPAAYGELLASYWSLLLIGGIGASLYPHALQRVYVARSEKRLQRSLILLAFIPFLTVLSALIIGITGMVALPGLGRLQSDQIFPLMLNALAGNYYWLAIFIYTGAMAAIMSTADSVLLTLASIFTRDIYFPFFHPSASQRHLARIGRAFNVLILLSVGMVAIYPFTTLWQLAKIKVEFLLQLYPMLILGLYWRNLSKFPAMLGFFVGIGSVAVGRLLGYETVGFLQVSLWAFFLNLVLTMGLSLVYPPDREEKARVRRLFFSLFENRLQKGEPAA